MSDISDDDVVGTQKKRPCWPLDEESDMEVAKESDVDEIDCRRGSKRYVCSIHDMTTNPI